jgi:hypothetical protein
VARASRSERTLESTPGTLAAADVWGATAAVEYVVASGSLAEGALTALPAATAVVAPDMALACTHTQALGRLLCGAARHAACRCNSIDRVYQI